MCFMTHFSLEIDPVPKARPRFTRQGRTYTPKKTHDFEKIVADRAKFAMGSSEPLDTPVVAYIYLTFQVPKSYSKTRTKNCLDGYEMHTKKPDLDNCVKAITDAMNGIVFKDDSQIVGIHAKKEWGKVGMIEIVVKENV